MDNVLDKENSTWGWWGHILSQEGGNIRYKYGASRISFSVILTYNTITNHHQQSQNFFPQIIVTQ